jgi:hypothetical protein
MKRPNPGVAEEDSMQAMHRLGACALSLLVLGAILAPAHADEGATVGVDVNAGILTGFGLDLAVPVNNYVGVRLTADGYSYSRNSTAYGTSVAWNAKLKLADAGVILDIYPFAGSFRISGGMVHDGTRISLNASPTQAITLNGNTYNPGDLGSADGEVTFKSSVPYVGIGAGNLAGSRGFHFIADVGVLLTGKPTATLTATCGSNPAVCTTLQADASAEQAKMQNNVNKLNFWPAVRLGVGYAF